eukprot:14774-Rhodomonas_salina.1
MSTNLTPAVCEIASSLLAFPACELSDCLVKMNWGLSFDVVEEARNHRKMLRAVHTSKKNLYTPGKELDSAIEAYAKVFMPSLHEVFAGKREYEAPSVE